MARRRSFKEMDCSIARALDVLGEWWTLLVVREAFRGVRRFDEFERRLEIAPNILAVRLRNLVDEGVLETKKYSERPERYEYRLTEKGRDLFPIIVALLQWGDRWYGEAGAPVVLEHVTCGGDADPRMACGHCGERLTARETRATAGPGATGPGSSLLRAKAV
jgi:DNA-binding HxlR family transcriptional regulator